MSKPVFFIGGAQRSGTTYLYSILDQHPEICMARPSTPEPKFFMDARQVSMGREYYLNKFYTDTAHIKIYGEKSTSYIESAEAGKRILTMFPEAKIIFILRNPVARAISNFFFSVANGLEKRTLTEVFIDKKPASSQYSTSVSPFKYIERGEYRHYLEPFFLSFGRDNVRILLFEDMIEPNTFAKDTFEFLGVDPGFRPLRLYEKVNASEETFDVDEHILAKLREHFRPHNASLEQLLGISLKKWNE
jgi:hypothetical protein